MAGSAAPRVLGRYVLHDEIAAGGMASVHLGRLRGSVGFSRTVAIKRLHPQFAKDPEFVAMFLDEARIAARIRHPNVVPTLDVVDADGELFLVMDYVEGESLARLVRACQRGGAPPPVRLVSAIVIGTLHGLHAAHEAKGELGEALGIVHRDVSPQNVLVGLDGVARVLDFGVAKALGRSQVTREGQLKGKLPYMAPEQIRRGGSVSRRTDVYAAAVVLWEALTARRLFQGDDEAQILAAVLDGHVDPPSHFTPGISPQLDALVLRGLAADPMQRFESAREMASALERIVPPATGAEVSSWVERLAGEALAKRSARVAAIEAGVSSTSADVVQPEEEATLDATTRLAAVASQASTVSLATPTGPTSPTVTTGTRRARLAIMAALALFVSVAAVVGIGRFTRESPDIPDRSTSMPKDSAATPTASTVSTTIDTIPTTTATTATEIVTTASVLSPAKSATPSASLAPHPTSTLKKPLPPAPPPAAGACNPPFYYDQGIKKFKTECL